MKCEDKAKRKKYISAGLVLLAVSLAAVCAVTIAYMFSKSAATVNEFEKATVSCVVVEEFDGTEKSRVAVKNTSNIPAYLRVRLVSYWVNDKNEIMAKPSAMPQFVTAQGWLPQGNNTYCYTKKVDPKESTPNLLAEGVIVTREEDGLLQVIEVFADAVQGDPSKTVEESWKVTVDKNGVIIGIKSNNEKI